MCENDSPHSQELGSANIFLSKSLFNPRNDEKFKDQKIHFLTISLAHELIRCLTAENFGVNSLKVDEANQSKKEISPKLNKFLISTK